MATVDPQKLSTHNREIMTHGKIVLVTHSAHAEPGAVAEALHARGFETARCCPLLGDQLPPLIKGRPQGFLGAIVFGGPMGVNDVEEHPFLRDELDWVSGQLEAGAPLLGICLGAQLMAAALGADVGTRPDGRVEIGYHRIEGTAAGRLLFPDPMQVYQWHREGFSVPLGATLLAGGAVFPHQAFSYGDAAYGIQFHPEMTPETLDRWVTSEGGAPQLSLSGAQAADAQRAEAVRNDPVVRAWFDRFLGIWL